MGLEDSFQNNVVTKAYRLSRRCIYVASLDLQTQVKGMRLKETNQNYKFKNFHLILSISNFFPYSATSISFR